MVAWGDGQSERNGIMESGRAKGMALVMEIKIFIANILFHTFFLRGEGG